jgi:hypothetical protein
MKLQAGLFLLFFTVFALSSCDAIGTIFKAGMWWAFFLVGLGIVLILWLVNKARK